MFYLSSNGYAHYIQGVNAQRLDAFHAAICGKIMEPESVAGDGTGKICPACESIYIHDERLRKEVLSTLRAKLART